MNSIALAAFLQLALTLLAVFAAYFLGVFAERKRQINAALDAEAQQRKAGIDRLLQEVREDQLYSIRNRFDDTSG